MPLFKTLKNVLQGLYFYCKSTLYFLQTIFLYRFLSELRKLIPIVRSICPETMLAAELEKCVTHTIVGPLEEVLKSFETPAKLVQKRKDKLLDYHRLSQSDRNASNQGAGGLIYNVYKLMAECHIRVLA